MTQKPLLRVTTVSNYLFSPFFHYYVHHLAMRAFLYSTHRKETGAVLDVHCCLPCHPSPHSALSLSLDLLPPDFFFTLSSPIILLSAYNVCNLYLECHLRKPLSCHSHTRAVSKDSCSACHPARLLPLLWACGERCYSDRQHPHEMRRHAHECMEEGKHAE